MSCTSSNRCCARCQFSASCLSMSRQNSKLGDDDCCFLAGLSVCAAVSLSASDSVSTNNSSSTVYAVAYFRQLYSQLFLNVSARLLYLCLLSYECPVISVHVHRLDVRWYYCLVRLMLAAATEFADARCSVGVLAS